MTDEPLVVRRVRSRDPLDEHDYIKDDGTGFGSIQRSRSTQSVSTASTTNILQLPDELIEKIFSFLLLRDLANAIMVCKDWYEVGSHRSLWDKYGTLMELHSHVLDAICDALASSRSPPTACGIFSELAFCGGWLLQTTLYRPTTRRIANAGHGNANRRWNLQSPTIAVLKYQHTSGGPSLLALHSNMCS